MSDELVVHQPQSQLMAPVATLEELQAAYQLKKDFVESVMHEGIDYGTIPGTGTKPTLLKAGAEKITTLYGLQTTFSLVDEVEDFDGSDHEGEPFFYYRYRCNLLKGDYVMANAEGSCNSWEKKYRWRRGKVECPSCGQELRRSKQNPEWYCWVKTGGCGATYPLDEIDGNVEPIKNPDPYDTINTIQKMAQKRALVAAALIAGNVSDMFTQDLEDIVSDTPVQTRQPVNKAGKSAPAPPGEQPERPYNPGTVMAKLAEGTKAYAGHLKKGTKKWALGEKDAQIVAAVIDNYFGGESQQRHAIFQFLLGKASTKDWTDAEVGAVKNLWLCINDFNDEPDPDSQVELENLWYHVQATQGQSELFPDKA